MQNITINNKQDNTMANENMNISIKRITSALGCILAAFTLAYAIPNTAIASSDIEDKTSQFDE